MPRRSVMLTAMAHASHPGPSFAVAGAATLLAVSARNSVGTCVLVACAVLAGQVSIGWGNDRIDAARDRRVGHPGKPLATGAISQVTVDVAIGAALVATVALSLALGWRAGGLHLIAVAVAWAYNLWLKSTWVSWLPYTLSFGALPAVATLARPDHPWPAAWIVAASAVLGTAVNFGNAVQYLADRPESDISGLPDRIGGKASLVVTGVLLIGSAALIAAGPPSAPTALSWVQLAITLVAVPIGTRLVWRRADTRAPFYGVLALAPLQLLVAVITGTPLH